MTANETARAQRYAEALRDCIKARTAPPVIGTGGGLSLGATEWDMARAVMAVADAEIAQVQEEAEGWAESSAEAFGAWHEATARAEAAEAKVRRVEALRDECAGQHGQCWNSVFARRIDAALAGPERPDYREECRR